MEAKPNIVFFFTDDQRFDTINALGNEKIITPNIDRLVNSGVTFTHAHIPGGTVGAVCMPSRAMIHSGKSLFHLHNSGSSVPTGHSLLGETLKNNGYRTFGTGKWHNGTEAYARSFTDGDGIFFGGMNDHWNVPALHYDPSGKYDSRLPYIKDWLYKKDVDYIHADHVKNGKHSSELFAGDNGLAIGQHGLMGKQSCYDHSMRIPFVFSGPGIPKGTQSGSLVYLLDIFPTLCDLVNIEKPDNIDGISLNEALQNPNQEVRGCVYLTYGDVQRGVSDKEFKLIEYVIKDKHIMTQLFELKNDPWELNNMAESGAYSKKLTEMRTKLFQLRDEWDDKDTTFGKTFWSAINRACPI